MEAKADVCTHFVTESSSARAAETRKPLVVKIRGLRSRAGWENLCCSLVALGALPEIFGRECFWKYSLLSVFIFHLPSSLCISVFKFPPSVGASSYWTRVQLTDLILSGFFVVVNHCKTPNTHILRLWGWGPQHMNLDRGNIVQTIIVNFGEHQDDDSTTAWPTPEGKLKEGKGRLWTLSSCDNVGDPCRVCIAPETLRVSHKVWKYFGYSSTLQQRYSTEQTQSFEGLRRTKWQTLPQVTVLLA
jgi:hypothetical protein